MMLALFFVSDVLCWWQFLFISVSEWRKLSWSHAATLWRQINLPLNIMCNKWTLKKTSGPKEFQSFFFSYCFVLKHYSPHQDTFHTWLPLQRLFMLRLTFISNSTRVRAAQKGWHLVSCPLLPWEIPSPRSSENVQRLKVSAQTWAKENHPVKLTSLICSCLRWLWSYINQSL